jgi:hypothetical protein
MSPFPGLDSGVDRRLNGKTDDGSNGKNPSQSSAAIFSRLRNQAASSSISAAQR